MDELHEVEANIEKTEENIRSLNREIIEAEAAKRALSLQKLEIQAKKEDADTTIKVLSRRLQVEHSNKRSLDAKKWAIIKGRE